MKDRDKSNGYIAAPSRRRALALMFSACRWLSAAPALATRTQPVRLAISESLVSGVNINDARAAMVIWLRQMQAELKIPIEVDPDVFQTPAEIVRRARAGLFDAVALNIVEYRQIADVLDSSQIVCETAEMDQYVLLVKQGGGIRKLADLKGRRLLMLTTPKMCVASPWLSTILDEEHLGRTDQFFSSVVEDPKAARVVLPVFFGQNDACLTSTKSFRLMGELNPQVANGLTAIATSPLLVVTFYAFHRNYQGGNRDRFARVYANMSGSVAGKQLSTLFQFNNLVVKDGTCLDSSLAVLDKAEHIGTRPGAGPREGK